MKGPLLIGWLLVLGLSTFTAAYADGPVQMVAMPTIMHQANTLVMPVTVRLTNTGEAANGSLIAGGPDKRVSVPVSLAAGESKRMIVFSPTWVKETVENGIRVSEDVRYSTVDLVLNSSSGPTKAEQTLASSGQESTSLLISTRVHSLDYLAGPESEGSQSKQVQMFLKKHPGFSSDWFVKGERVSVLPPDRLVARADAFLGFRTIFLGHGSQSLTDLEVAAIKESVLNGSTVVIGTNSRSAFADPRWNVERGSQAGITYLGTGAVVNLGFDFEPAAPAPDFRFKVLKQLVSDRFHLGNPDLNSDQLELGAASPNNPFQVHLPSFFQVASLIAAYFLLVVPVNYFLLKRIHKPEFMWITAPLLAGSFAGILFHSGGSLYSSKAAVVADGNLISQEGVPASVFNGAFGIFTPRAGTLDLNLKPQTVSIDDYLDPRHYSQRQALSGMPLIADTGTQNIPALPCSSLSFHQFKVRQVLPRFCPVHFEVKRVTGGQLAVTAKNTSGRELKEFALVAGRFTRWRETLQPGESVSLTTHGPLDLPEKVRAAYLKAAAQPGVNNTDRKEAEMLAQTEGRICATAQALDFPVGPQVGSGASYRSRVNLYCFCSRRLSDE